METSSSLDADFKEHHSSQVTVQTSTLDVVLKDAEDVVLIKIDVEGHERQAFEGGEGVVRRNRPYVAIELLDRGDFGYFNDFVNRSDYLSYRLRAHEAIQADEMRFDAAAWNHVLVPKEKNAEFLALLAGLQIPVTRE